MIDHSILRSKLSVPETHIRALPVLPGPAPGVEEPRERAALLNGPVRENREPSPEERREKAGVERERERGLGTQNRGTKRLQVG